MSRKKSAPARKRRPRKPWIDKKGLKARVREWAGKIGVQVREIHVRAMKTKWASMTADGHRLTLNPELMTRHPKFVDYVIVHELLHIRVPNHGKLFKSLMTIHLPRWEEYAGLEKGT